MNVLYTINHIYQKKSTENMILRGKWYLSPKSEIWLSLGKVFEVEIPQVGENIEPWDFHILLVESKIESILATSHKAGVVYSLKPNNTYLREMPLKVWASASCYLCTISQWTRILSNIALKKLLHICRGTHLQKCHCRTVCNSKNL